MTTIAGRIDRRRRVDAPRERVWSVLADVDRLDRILPEVREYRKVDGGYRWTLEGVSALGYHVRPTFVVRYVLDGPERLGIETLHEYGGNAESGGAIELAEVDGGTDVRLDLSVSVDVGLPRMLRGPANGLLREELSRLADGFLRNLDRAAR